MLCCGLEVLSSLNFASDGVKPAILLGVLEQSFESLSLSDKAIIVISSSLSSGVLSSVRLFLGQ